MSNGLRNHNILIVDGNQPTLESIHAVLSATPATVASIQLPTGWDVCEETSARLHDADLLICDLELNQSPLLGQCSGAFIFLSDVQRSDITFKRLEHGSFYCLAKPVCPELLLLIAEIALRRQRKHAPVSSPMFPALAGIPMSSSPTNTLPSAWPTTGHSVF